MYNRVSIVSPISYTGKPVPVQEDTQTPIEHIPIAKKLGDKKTRAVGSLSVLGAGAVLGPVAGMGLDKLSGASGSLVKWSKFISDKTLKLDANLAKWSIGAKIKKFIDPIKNKIFKTQNIEKFKDGFYSSGGLKGAAKAAKQAAEKAGNLKGAAVAGRTLETLEKISKHGLAGRFVGKTGIFLKKNLTGTLGVINGIFAAMTVNSVIKAKKGEKVSTFMEDFLGTWVGSIGGYRLFENLLKGLSKFEDPATRKIVGKGVIPTVAKLVYKIPLKGFVFPLAGAMLISTIMQKLSYKIFGKPTKEMPQVIDSVDDFNNWLEQTGWSYTAAGTPVLTETATTTGNKTKEIPQ